MDLQGDPIKVRRHAANGQGYATPLGRAASPPRCPKAAEGRRTPGRFARQGAQSPARRGAPPTAALGETRPTWVLAGSPLPKTNSVCPFPSPTLAAPRSSEDHLPAAAKTPEIRACIQWPIGTQHRHAPNRPVDQWPTSLGQSILFRRLWQPHNSRAEMPSSAIGRITRCSDGGSFFGMSATWEVWLSSCSSFAELILTVGSWLRHSL
jgi:hypothetical protein